MLRFLFLLFLFFLITRLIMKAFRAGNRTAKDYHTHYQNKQQTRREGDIHVDHVPEEERKKKQNKEQGEFIDYEEVE